MRDGVFINTMEALQQNKKDKFPWYNQLFLTNIITQEEAVRLNPTVKGVTGLVDDYSKLIEYYGSKNDLIAEYFTLKMHRLLGQQSTIQVLEGKVTPKTLHKDKEKERTTERERSREKQLPPFASRMSYRSTKRKKFADDTLEMTYSQFQSNSVFVVNELNVQRMDLQMRLQAVKLRQEENISRMLKHRNKESVETNGTT